MMILILEIIVVFLGDTNVIAGPASVPTKNELSSIIVLNACGQDPIPCLISCIIRLEDVKLHRSPILDFAKESHFPYANGSPIHVTIFKHIHVQDPGAIIFTKKLGDENHYCFTVSGQYWTSKISNCLNGK